MNSGLDVLPRSPLPKRVNFRFEKQLCILAAAVTAIASLLVASDLLMAMLAKYVQRDWLGLGRHLIFGFIIAFLVYGGAVYIMTRWAYYTRRARHVPTDGDALTRLFGADAPTLTILVPSYKEEDKVVFQTMMSASLQQYRKKRVLLLLDDPPRPKHEADRVALEGARTIPSRIAETLRPMAKFTASARMQFYTRLALPNFDTRDEYVRLFTAYEQVISWFDRYAQTYPVSDHADQAFVDSVLRKQSSLLAERMRTLRTQLDSPLTQESDAILALEYSRLVSVFNVDVDSFERKSYENLSHESNKAMNLNSYIGLMGKSFKTVVRGDRLFLEETSPGRGDTTFPAADFVITLDADSLIVPDYALRLVDEMLQPEHERLAVVQTPYSAFPGATKALERIAGATTDIQYIIHQGFTHFNGTFWVGANALIRRTALDDIAVTEQERGYTITRYIQDRTVIEDTESSVDLIERGWYLRNYPERMAFSATPPDFGALVIQRRRWANGGLIILPKLLRYLARGPFSTAKFAEAFVRVHYLSSIAVVNMGLTLALAIPLATDISTVWLPLTSLGYFALYGRDLKLTGYKFRDLFGVYAVNLLLIPVNLAGVFKSIQQAWTKEKIPFGRTPKIGDRTATQPIFVLVLFALVGDWVYASATSFADTYYLHGLFALINAAILLYAIVTYLGLKNAWVDVVVGTAEQRQFLARKLYRQWARSSRRVLGVLGRTPLVRLAVRSRPVIGAASNGARANKAA